MKHFNRFFVKQINDNIAKYVALIIFFVFGVAFGIAFVFGMSPELSENLAETIRTTCNSITENNLDKSKILWLEIIKNLRNVAFIFLGGFSKFLIILPFAVVFASGFSYGFTVGYMSVHFGGNGFLMGFSSIISNLLITIPIYILLSVFSLNYNRTKLRNKTEKGYIIRNLALFSLAFSVLLLPVFINSYLITDIVLKICAKVN